MPPEHPFIWLDHLLQKNGEEILLHCPKCDPSGEKYKLSVNIKKHKFQCWSCEWKGRSLRPVLAAFGAAEGSSGVVEPPTPSLGTWRGPAAPALTNEACTSLPDFGFQSIFATGLAARIARNYVYSRGISPEQAEKHNVQHCYAGKYAGRIIFLIHEGYRVVNFVARAYGDAKPKYLNLPTEHALVRRESLVFNCGDIAQKKRMIIVEGVIDAMVLGDEAVATFGKKVTDDQFMKMLRVDSELYVVALDADAVKEAASLYSRFKGMGRNVRLARMPMRQDASSLGKENAMTYIDHAEEMSLGEITAVIMGR